MNLFEKIQNYIEVTSAIEKHFFIKKSPFYIILNNFTKFFKKKYSKILSNYSERKFNILMLKNYCKMCYNEIELFLIVISELLFIFYEIEMIEENKPYLGFFTYQNIYNFMQNIVFDLNEIYEIVMSFQIKLDFMRSEIFKKGINVCIELTANELGIPPFIALNHSTFRYFKENNLSSELLKQYNSLPQSIKFILSNNLH